MFNKDNIPVELRGLDKWVLWKYEVNKDGEKTKIPYQSIFPKIRAKSNKSSTWSSFDKAVAVFEKGGFDGLGFMTEKDDYIVGIDLDNKEGQKERDEIFKGIISDFNSYTEISPSGKGYRIFVMGFKPNKSCKYEDLGIECYEDRRFFTVTGNTIVKEAVKESQDELEKFFKKYFKEKKPKTPPAPTPVSFDDEKILDLMFSASNGGRIIQLYNGDDSRYQSRSQADLALASYISFYTQDAQQIERIMRSSGLVREKWDRSDNWLQKFQIREVLSTLSETYNAKFEIDLQNFMKGKDV